MKATAQTPKQGQTLPQAASAPFRRRIRHWKEVFAADGRYVWSKAVVVNGQRVQPGSPVDKTGLPQGRLRRMWESGWVQRTDWTPRTVVRDIEATVPHG